MYGQGGHKLEINIPLQQFFANSKGGGLRIEGGIISSEYGILYLYCSQFLSKQRLQFKFSVSELSYELFADSLTCGNSTFYSLAVTLNSDWNSNSEHLRMRLKCPNS